MTFTTTLLHDITGCTGLEAMEALLSATGQSMMITGHEVAGNLPPGEKGKEIAGRLQRVRGYRSSAKIIENLNIICQNAARPQPTRRLGSPNLRARVDPQ